MRRAALLALLVAGCVPGQESFDPTSIGSIAGYTAWTYGGYFTDPVPGHGDSVRDVYVNDVGAGYTHGGRYPVGTILVKEVQAKVVMDGQPSAGDMKYIAVMRKLGPDGRAPVPIEGGWVFSFLDGGATPGGEETYWDLCWATCHRQAPVDGAFFDYGE